MKRNKSRANESIAATTTTTTPTTGDNTISESDEPRKLTAAAATITTAKQAFDKTDYFRHATQGQQVQSLLLANSDQYTSSTNRSEEEITNITSRLSAFIPRIIMANKSHQKNVNSSSGGGDMNPAKTMKKMLQNDANSKSGRQTRNAGGGDDIEANSKPNTAALCVNKFKWALLLLMGVILISAATLITLFSFTLLDNEDQCFSQNSPFQQTSYKLFATKTLYTTTLNVLTKSSSSSSSSPPSFTIINPSPSASSLNSNNHHQQHILQQQSASFASNNNYDKSSITLPSIFSPDDSLESLNQRLTEFGCKVRQLHYYGRHAARLPNKEEITRINSDIQAIQSRIDLSKYQQQQPSSSSSSFPNGQGSTQQQAPPPVVVTTPPTTSSHPHHDNKSEVVCFDPLIQFKQWLSFASPEQGNLLMETGAQETLAIAQRFKAIFPELFDGNRSKIEFGTTQEIRTAQTAISFLKELDNYQLGFCRPDEFPTENTSDKTKASEIKDSPCFTKFIRHFAKKELSFHKTCRELSKEETHIELNLKLHDSNRTNFIAQSVTKKLKLSDALTSEETKSIYDACRYESALTGASSIWCSLFSEKELRFYEYLTDIDDFFNQAYGNPDLATSACPVAIGLMNSIVNYTRRSMEPSLSEIQSEAYFHFSHSEVIQKILAASVDLKRDPAYSPSVILDHLLHGTVPKGRQWQTSLFTPFSANIAFTVYQCPKAVPARRPPPSTGDASAIVMNVLPPSLFKVVAGLNEQPILLEGCPDYVCDLNEMLYSSKLLHEKKCDLEEICKSRVKVT